MLGEAEIPKNSGEFREGNKLGLEKQKITRSE